MAEGTTKSMSMFFNGRVFGSFTETGASIKANNQQIQTSAGVVMPTAPPAATYTGSFVAVDGDDEVVNSIDLLQQKKTFDLQLGVVGNKVMMQRVRIEEISLSSSKEAGSTTGTMSLMGIGEVKLEA